MSVLFAMGIPTTTDDTGYLLWLSQNWTVFVLPTLAFLAMLTAFVVRKMRGWAASTPGSSGPPAAQMTNMGTEHVHPDPDIQWPFELQYNPW